VESVQNSPFFFFVLDLVKPPINSQLPPVDQSGRSIFPTRRYLPARLGTFTTKANRMWGGAALIIRYCLCVFSVCLFVFFVANLNIFFSKKKKIPLHTNEIVSPISHRKSE
jgi:hypothetical protein